MNIVTSNVKTCTYMVMISSPNLDNKIACIHGAIHIHLGVVALQRSCIQGPTIVRNMQLQELGSFVISFLIEVLTKGHTHAHTQHLHHFCLINVGYHSELHAATTFFYLHCQKHSCKSFHILWCAY